LEKIIKYLDTKLDKKEKEKEGEYQTYFIKNKESVLARYDSSFFNNRKSKEFKIIEKINSNQEVKSNEEKKTNLIDDSSSKNSKETSSSSIPKFNKNTFYDCEEEKVILIYKRYVKLYKDFFDSKKKKFDISKIPDIYDNIKYDIIHNKSIIGETALELYNSITNLADFVMPLEYGIKIEEKIKIGLKFIKPLLNKIYKDLLWILNINSTFSSEAFIKNEGSRDNLSDNLSSDNDFDSSIKDLKCLESEEQNYFCLDKNKLDKGEIKSAWRHVKTKIYFTSQSHLYSLLNTLIYSMNSFLVDNDEKNEANKIWSVFDLDYCSHIVFRLFENYNVDKKSKERYRIEIIVSPGANNDLSKCDNTHLVPLSSWIILNDHLNLSDIQKYFNFILGQ
jgi:inositol hexakisphosphate/diphosphoinositol-pentakisphosphate kinase